jgi:uncharacterized protein YabN with tetrapyrrole methylase and pyrophosphatase domain
VKRELQAQAERLEDTNGEAWAQTIGMLLFHAVNAARMLKIDPELVLYAVTNTIIDRFEYENA